jgi:hypothetical protein
MDLRTEQPKLEWLPATNVRMSFKFWSAPTVPYPAVLLDTPTGAFEIEDVGFGLLAQTKAGVTDSFYRISPDVGASPNTICFDV